MPELLPGSLSRLDEAVGAVSAEITKWQDNNNNNNFNESVAFDNIPPYLLYLPILLLPLLISVIGIAIVVSHRHLCQSQIASRTTFLHSLFSILNSTPVIQASSTAWSLLITPPSVSISFCFMPSASPKVESNATYQEESSVTQSNLDQYGIFPSNYPPHHPSSGSGGGSQSSPQSGETDGMLREPGFEQELGYARDSQETSESRRPVTSPRLLPPELTGKSHPKKYKSPNAKGNPYISKLPNEVLSHTLSFLDPVSLTSVSFVSRRFHALVTSPHAWKTAFSRYFPQHSNQHDTDAYPTAARYFARLSNLGTHRSEYILRTQLLRSLKRGRPYLHSGLKPNNSSQNPSNFSMITYNPKLGDSTITHLHADFAKNRVIAASQITGLYSHSDPRTGYVEVEQRGHPGYSPLGLQHVSQDGIGALDISESRGQVIGDGREGFPSFFLERASSHLPPIQFISEHGPNASITCAWIAKKDTIVNTSGHRILSASGSSKGTVQFQSTEASWMSFHVCPGIPILDIRIDDGYTKARERRNRVWCIVINALGEVWYMKGKLPKKTLILGRNMGEQPPPEFTPWYVVIPTRKENGPVGFDILARTNITPTLEEVQQQNTWLHTQPDVWAVTHSEHWRMDYFIEADFGGQNFIVGCKGLEEGPNTVRQHAKLAKYSRILDSVREEAISEVFIKNVYGRGYHKEVEELVPRPSDEIEPLDEWHHIEFSIPRNSGKDFAFITATAIDMSNLAILSAHEDPLLTRSKGAGSMPQQVAGQLSRLFAIGTDTGAVHIYNSRQPFSSSIHPLPPLHTISTASPSISSLALSSLYLVHGGTDGLVQAWDPLVSLTDPIRAIHSRFSTRARRRLAQAANSVHGIGENHFAARAIFLDPDPCQLRGIVALGTHIRSWSFSSSVERVEENSNARRRRKGARRDSNTLHGASIGLLKKGNSSKAPIPRDIIAEAERIGAQRFEDDKKKDKMKKRFGVGHENLAGMTEEEMIMYAMMISEESFEKERGLSDTAGSSGGSGFGDSVSGVGSIAGGEDEVWMYSESPSIGVSESPSSHDGWIDSPFDKPGESSSVAAAASPTNVDDDEALAKALQESFDLEDTSRSPPSGVDIPIKFAKSKKKGKGKGSAAVPARRTSSSATEQDQFDKDLELAIQLSMKE